MSAPKTHRTPPKGSATRGFAVTPSDTNDLPNGPADYILVKTAGEYTLLLAADPDNGAQPYYLAAGVLHKLAVRRVFQTNAASTDGIRALYN